MVTLRPYQIELADKALDILKRLNIVYLAMEVRTGKTLTALSIAEKFGANNVLFLTKKNAISSIEKDFAVLNPGYNLTVINDESMHKVTGIFDLVIHDEHHRFGAFPKPGKACQQYKKMFGHLPQIFLSGTPTPESYSQIYHQFWVSKRSPFEERTFYKWSKTFVNVIERHLGYAQIRDYSNAYWDKITPIIEPYMIRFTQADAGFDTEIKEHFLEVEPNQTVKNIIGTLLKDQVIQGKNNTITADTPVKMQSKLHQLCSGTILFDEVEGMPRASMVLDTSKAEYIKQKFSGNQIVIFYKFVQELDAIKKIFGNSVTNDLSEFNSSNKSIALQIVSGREGINLSKAEAIVFYNIDFSATSYWQARNRLTTIDRVKSDVYWVFSKNGIEKKIYEAVTKKKNYTVSMFQKDFGVSYSNRTDKKVQSARVLCSQAN